MAPLGEMRGSVPATRGDGEGLIDSGAVELRELAPVAVDGDGDGDAMLVGTVVFDGRHDKTLATNNSSPKHRLSILLVFREALNVRPPFIS